MNPPASYDSTISLPSSKLPTTTPSASTTPPHRPLPTPSLLPHLLTRWTTDTGIMARSAQLIPPTSPLLLAPSFQSDRALFSGRALWTPEIIARGRPEALVVIRHAFHVLETLVLGDGREWVDGGVGRGGPGRADIEAVWTVHWVLGMEGAVPGDVFGRNVFPRVWAWVGRFDEAVRAAKRKGEKPGTLTGVEAKGVILGCEDAVEREGDVVDPLDPLGLRKGDVVEVFPTDSGFGHKDTGRLLKLDMEEVVIAVATPEGGKEVRVHMPRWGFRVKKVDAGARL